MGVRIPDDLLLQMTFGKITADQIVSKVSEINQNVGADMYIIFGAHGHIVEFIGCPDVDLLPAFANYCSIFTSTEPSRLLHVKPLDPLVLPVTLCDKSQCIWVLFSDLGLAECKTMEDATKNIETLMKKWPSTRIEDFAILIGKEVGFSKSDYTDSCRTHYADCWDM